ncbi:DNA repair protein RecN [Anaerovorax odorimutans]|uniref:DNA repair protein RecN n=1 Tax=Anaerovorax odorimutans TaxID=109327 RepID=UPI000419123C|nr:DNA repair protein RecN [Anaerovorax odorimutans]
MISHIKIKDFAIIDNVDIDFYSGLNIITGETGSGKSIIIEAISLALGSRADTTFVRSGKEKAIIQLIVEEDKKEYIITREVFAAGKSICKVNDEIVSVSYLNKLCKKIVDIHGQYDNQSLLNPEYHLSLIDKYGSDIIDPVKDKVAVLYEEYTNINNKLNSLLKNAAESERKRDFMQFELQEIESVNPYIGEDEELSSDLLILQNSEKIYQNLSSAYEIIYENSPSAFEGLGKSIHLLQEISDYSKDLSKLTESFSDNYYKFEDLIKDIRKEKESISFSSENLDETINRLNSLDTLKRKYGGSIEKVLKYKENLISNINNIENIDVLREELSAKLKNCHEKLQKHSEKLTSLRKQISEKIEKKINNELKELNFNHAALSIEFNDNKENGKINFSSNGTDTVEFLIITNLGETPKPLAKIASGGEISRIMLAFKSITCDYDNIPSMIFDEIDNGISGITASIVGKKLRQISKNHQVICITHLPQIASFSDHHYKIQKIFDEKSTYTDIISLSYDEKIKEIARLLGGTNITDTTLKSAEELIKLSIQ